ncbi:dipeptidase [Chloroflexi bacterium TSY]|nr:dipeptidase [Chloroflexi bacterium TSY]
MRKPNIVIDGTQYSRWDRTIFEEMHAGGVTAVHVTVVYWEDTVETLRNLAAWNQLFQHHGDLIRPVRTAQDVRRAKEEGRVGIIFGFQNCSPLEGHIGFVEIFHQLGVRFMQLTYNNQTLLASGCYEAVDSGITRFGKQVIQEMNRVGMVIDMSHSGERSTLEAVEISQRPIVVSHANPLFFHDSLRNKSDAVLKALAQNGGILGFSLYPFHLKNNSQCTLADFCAMVAQTAELMGIEHIGIGTDLCQNQPLSILEWMRNGRWTKEKDYGEGSADNAKWPDPLPWFHSNAHFPNLVQGLADYGFNQDEIALIMGGNWLRFFEESFEPVTDDV